MIYPGAVYENLVLGVKARNVTVEADPHESEEENDDAYLKNMQPRSDADTITDILLYNPMHYFIVSTTLGHILVFKGDISLSGGNESGTDRAHQDDRDRQKADKP